MLLGIFCTNLSFFNTASGMDCMKLVTSRNPNSKGAQFQYRKRYGLHAIMVSEFGYVIAQQVSIPQAVWIACNSKPIRLPFLARSVSIPQAVWIACNVVTLLRVQHDAERSVSIPQAVWIACNFGREAEPTRLLTVSIPQAVWIACNTVPHSPWDS